MLNIVGVSSITETKTGGGATNNRFEIHNRLCDTEAGCSKQQLDQLTRGCPQRKNEHIFHYITTLHYSNGSDI